MFPCPKFIATLLMLLSLGGCSFLDLHEDLEEVGKLVTISGEITANPGTTAAIKVVLFRGSNDNLEVMRYSTQKHLGNYLFIIEPGTYQVFAFEDSNRDNRYTAPERAERSAILDLTSPGSRQEVNIEIGPRPAADLLAEIAQIRKNGVIRRQETRLQIGTITSLDNEIFSRQNGGKGLWQPYKFIQEVPFGCFFLEEYDPDKKIVLFVHGVSGTPSQFKALIDSLDNDRFQPLVAFYPTGLPLPLISQYLNSLILELHVVLDFETISLVAHSMGGLVSRGVLNIQASQADPLVDCFISISTPWNGHAAASSGLKYAPVVIPVWRDVAPGSDFLETLFSTPLAETTPHYILFGFKGSSRTTGGNSDGVVSIASQLRPIAQEGARLVRGFDEQHVSILSNSKVAELMNQLLEENL